MNISMVYVKFLSFTRVSFLFLVACATNFTIAYFCNTYIERHLCK